jgi:type IV secretory pathway TraG/TraD family ATPase VirD4
MKQRGDEARKQYKVEVNLNQFQNGIEKEKISSVMNEASNELNEWTYAVKIRKQVMG